jgi:hypothetical protein
MYTHEKEKFIDKPIQEQIKKCKPADLNENECLIIFDNKNFQVSSNQKSRITKVLR